ncbi:SDR family NAD(P)-dependent oxidoreductase [Pectobacteriaceae bacterium CE70]|uniref:NAD(P)-dependent oxidoreductase n=1 Tax=Serratia sp. (strain ATCC 39006) TaxID=104623 RepID=A0A2I5TKD3_SERS3|nr:SDR family NAD(P)-dependent oxidoreductase [Serratia sp. ATCC 39006]AUH00661.1 NAD(P)-dependent oxidoreductase [Serratia sp. ATCC 39006]AUH04982.1 NAD(P)-dependent oxidoreductase [Serratia sp. ATCC 39006]WJV68890.1 SDR family NAD(P)-dependent oxidoreductase [Pectobacteriaceae bacterium CE70]WJY12813.1 SDR family NAD(P)-dependent oxidoreductase [Pectobacteriaceae bacterium C80]
MNNVLAVPGYYPGLKGKTAIVTGGATGIGLAIARTLLAQGMTVAIGDINDMAAKNAAASLGDHCFSFGIDVRSRQSVIEGFSQVTAMLGGYQLLIANAGVSTMQRALDITDEEWDFNFDVNIRGIFLTNQIAARQFVQQKQGVIVNTASLAAKVGAPLLAHYSASKFAVLGWTQALARELAVEGIRVNAVCPGFVKTGMQTREVEWEATLRGISPEQVVQDYIRQTPLGRLQTPEDVADVVAFLSSDAARFMTGQGVNVTGGVYTG